MEVKNKEGFSALSEVVEAAIEGELMNQKGMTFDEAKAEFEKMVQYQMDKNGLSRSEAVTEVVANTVPVILTDEQQVQKILNGTVKQGASLLVGYTPEVYKKLGMPDLPLVVGSGHVYSMAKSKAEAQTDGKFHKGVNYHGLGSNIVENILDYVKDPVMVIAAKDVDLNAILLRSTHSVVALVDIGKGKESMVIPIAITAERSVDGNRMDVNASVQNATESQQCTCEKA